MGLRHAVFLMLALSGFGPLYAINVREINREKLTVRGDLTAREMDAPPAPTSPLSQSEATPPELPETPVLPELEALQAQAAQQEQKIENLTQIVMQQNQTISELQNGSQNLKEKINRCERENNWLQQSLLQNGSYTSQLENELCYWRDERGGEIDCVQGELYNLQCQLNTLLYQVEEMISYYPESFPNVPGVNGWQAGAELLFWTVEESELDFVVNNVAGHPFPTGVVGTLESAEFRWRPGARVYLDYTTCWDYWNIRLQGTFFYTRGQNTVTPDEGMILQSTFHQVSFDNNLFRATSDISLHYYIADLLLGHYFQLSPRISSYFFFGGMGAWIKQNWDLSYFTNIAGTYFTIDIDWRYKGGGLKVGGMMDWELPCNFSFYTQASLATLLGYYENINFEQGFQNNILEQIPVNSVNTQTRFAHTFQIMLGPSWTIRCRCFDLCLYALYEMNFWIGLQEVDRSFISDLTSDGRDSRHVEGILGLHGATIGFQATF